MIPTPHRQPDWLEWGAAGAALDGQASGDHYLVLPDAERPLVCMMDGLGHGVDARRASLDCASILEAHSGAALIDLVGYCHEGLRGTRGVAMTLLQIDRERDLLEWVAVGNVEGLVLREGLARGATFSAVVQRGGVVGYRLPPLKATHVNLQAGDLLVLATDGIQSGFADSVDQRLAPQELADTLLSRFARPSDDRLVLVLRYRKRSRP